MGKLYLHLWEVQLPLTMQDNASKKENASNQASEKTHIAMKFENNKFLNAIETLKSGDFAGWWVWPSRGFEGRVGRVTTYGLPLPVRAHF